MPLSDDAMYGRYGRCRVALGGGLVLDGSQCIVRNIVAFHGEELLHRGDRDVNLLIVPVVVAPADGLYAAHDGEADVVDVDRLAQHGAAWKQKRRAFKSEHDDTATINEIGLVDEAALGEGDKTNFSIVRLDAHHLARGVGIGAHFIEIIAIEETGNRAHFGESAQGGFVARGELVWPHAGVLVGESGDGGVPHHHNVIAEGRQLPVLTASKAFAESHENQQRTDSPCDAEHGQEAAQLVGRDGAKDLTECVGEGLHDGSTCLVRKKYCDSSWRRIWTDCKYAVWRGTVPSRTQARCPQTAVLTIQYGGRSMETAANLPESVTNAFVRAINRQDADALAALMTSGHRFVDSLGNVVEGREHMRKGWTGYFQMVPDYTVAIDETYSNGPVVILMGIAQGTYARGGKITPADEWRTPIAVRAFVEDGLVAEWRVYADNEPIRRLMAKGV